MFCRSTKFGHLTQTLCICQKTFCIDFVFEANTVSPLGPLFFCFFYPRCLLKENEHGIQQREDGPTPYLSTRNSKKFNSHFTELKPKEKWIIS